MRATNFQYADRTLQDFGLILAHFDSGKGIEITGGVEVTFNTVSVMNGKRNEVTAIKYDSRLESVWQVCKYSCDGDIQEISANEHRNIVRWLSQNKFLKLKILDDEHLDLYCMASFNVKKIEINGRLVGLELHVFTNAPFLYKEPEIITIENTIQDGRHSIYDVSHEEGFIYPYMEITVLEDGDLSIYNEIENRETIIKNCVAGELITMDYPVISSNDPMHKIQDDFNWDFFRIANTYLNGRNNLIVSIPCIIDIKYSPVVKVGF